MTDSASAILNAPPAAAAPAAAPATAAAPAAAPAPAPAAEAAAAVQAGVDTATGKVTSPIPWLDGVDADMLGYAQNKGWSDPKQVVEGYRNLEKMHGVPADRLLKLPAADADQATKDAFYEKLGRPKTADAYDFKVGDDAEATTRIKGLMHKHGISSEQARGLVADQLAFEQEIVGKQQEQHRAKVETEHNQLKSEWGAAFEQNLNAAREGRKLLGLNDGEVDAMSQVLGHKRLMTLLQSVAVNSGEDSFVAGNDRTSGSAMTPAQAEQKLKELGKDPGWRQRVLNGDVAANAEKKRLIAFMTAGQ